MVVSIGHKVASKVDSLKLKAGRERREDFNHPGMSPSWTSRKNHGGEDLPWTPQWAHRPAANGASLRPGTYRCQEHSVQNPHQILCGWYHHAPGPHCQASTVSTWAQQCAVARDPKVGVPRTFHLMTSSTKSLAMASAPDRCFKSHDLPEEYQRGRHRIGEAPADPHLSTDSGSDTDDSVDTESDRENVQLPIFRASDSACTGATSPERDPYGHPGILRKWRSVPGRIEFWYCTDTV